MNNEFSFMIIMGKENAPIASMTLQSATKGKKHRIKEVFPARTRHHGSSARANYANTQVLHVTHIPS